ncbi:maternal embryonic leucine zipper kinase [Cryptosporidium canis]|uniref:Maternal embryonic leucine zipper kinase n=1 Tax=Cryptosporidium canis TaxID=195482 RepID=A0ABQ8PAX1_9CRYT|nr:maternal embryonic leucine zipper kinase [Cryptosporidium canis]KAJ1614886.1 maternal embryonic leucine zipper kinase [Cryptosporidium canis]
MDCTLPLIKCDREQQQDLLLMNYDVLWDVDLGGSELCRVKLGICKKNGELVAIKIVTKTFCSSLEKDVLLYIQDKLESETCLSEISSKKSNNEYFPKIFDTFEDIDFIYIVMELSFGGELFHLLVRSEDRLSEETVSLIFSQICNALKVLHSIGIMHGDIKAENIMFSKKSRLDSVKLLDFGNSCPILSDGKSAVGKSSQLSTCNKCFLFSDPKRDAQFNQTYLDFWSCGKLLYLMLTGKYLEVEFHECFAFNDNTKKKILESSELKFCSDLVKDLLCKLLSYSYYQGELLTMEKVLCHPWFDLAKNTPIINRHIYPHDELIKVIS